MADQLRKSHKRKANRVGNEGDGPSVTIDVEAFRKLGTEAAETGARTGAESGAASAAESPTPVRLFDEGPLGAQAEVKPPKRRKTSTEYTQEHRERERQKETKASQAKLAEQTANTLITVAETLAISLAGQEASLQEAERLLISQSLPEVLKQATPEVIERVETIMYPGMLLVGVGAYAIRVSQLLAAKSAQAKAAKRAAAIIVPVVPAQPGDSPPAPQAPPTPAVNDDLASHDGREYINSRGLGDATTVL